MATVNLLPTGDVSNDWTLSTGSDVYALLDDNHTGFMTGDSSLLSSSSAGSSCIVSFADFGESYSAINSVTAVTRAGNNGRGRTFELTTRIISGGSTLYTESSGTQAASAAYRTQTYTTRTTSDGSNAWTKSDLDGLQMRIDLASHSGGLTRFTHCYYVIDYDLPVTTDNSIFFGTNF
jgi:hypothetical protein